MTHKFTQGPWSHRFEDGSIGSVEDAAGNAVAQALQISREDQLNKSSIRQANAKLIAAAPDLLKVAQLVLAGLTNGSVKSKPMLDFDAANDKEIPMVSLASILRAAIAKATGESA